MLAVNAMVNSGFTELVNTLTCSVAACPSLNSVGANSTRRMLTLHAGKESGHDWPVVQEQEMRDPIRAIGRDDRFLTGNSTVRFSPRQTLPRACTGRSKKISFPIAKADAAAIEPKKDRAKIPLEQIRTAAKAKPMSTDLKTSRTPVDLNGLIESFLWLESASQQSFPSPHDSESER